MHFFSYYLHPEAKRLRLHRTSVRTNTRAAAAALTDGGGPPRSPHRPEGAALLARAREGATEGGLHADDELPVVDQLLQVLLADGFCRHLGRTVPLVA